MLLTPQDHERIHRAVREAEAKTRGEIVCVVAEEASDYREVPLIWAAMVALAAPSIPLTLLSVIITVRQAFQGWGATEWVSAQSLVQGMAMLASMQFILFVLVTVLVFIPSIRRFLTPGMLKRSYVKQRAFEQFIGKGMANTKERTGVLLYVSLNDRCAELIADEGINSKTPPRTWDVVMERLIKGMKAGRPAEALVTAVENCGDLLAEHFPAAAPNPNELPDRLTELPSRQK
jgi:putative membrane protein